MSEEFWIIRNVRKNNNRDVILIDFFFNPYLN